MEDFLRTHLGAIAAVDFFSVEVLTLTGVVRYLVLFMIDLQTRRVQIGGMVPGEGSTRVDSLVSSMLLTVISPIRTMTCGEWLLPY